MILPLVLKRYAGRLGSYHFMRTIVSQQPAVVLASRGVVGYRSYSSGRLPDQAQVVVCGGGVVGCSVAYHLPKVGFKDVVLLEQGSIGCGTTWHATGLIGHLRGTHAETKLCSYSADLYSKLEEETGFGTGWKPTGAVTVARNKDRLTVLKRLQSVARTFQIEAEIISPQEAGKLCPLVRVDDLLGALWIPGDGVATSTDLCQSLAKGASLQGAQIFEKVCVERVEVENGRVCGVKTDKGDIKCEVFVNCGGLWARELGQLSNPLVNIPLQPVEHFIIVTKPMEGIDPMLPVVRDQCGRIAFREWSGGLIVGGFEPRGKPCFQDGIPKPFEFQLLPEDWDQFQILMEQTLHRIPAMKHTEIRQLVNGPESFTPDTHAILGEAPNVINYFVAAGMNSTGIATAGGAGKALAEWIAGGEPPFDLWTLDIRRFGPQHNNKSFLGERASEIVGRVYAMPWPKWEMETARNMKQSPLCSRLDEAGASWGCLMGWERPNWFARNENESRENEYTFEKPNWFENVREEHLACRENVAVFDLSSYVKFEIEGSEAEAAMQMLCTNNVAVPPGHIVYTGMLNGHGGFQTYCTVTRLCQNKYLTVSPTAHATHVAAWISHHLPSSVSLNDVTARYAVLAVMGPRSRDLIQKLTKTPLNNSSFPFATAQTTEFGFATGVRALRITYVGELGWELHTPIEYAQGVYDKLMEIGAEFGLRNAGMYALDSLRIEKGFLQWGHELDTYTTPWEAHLGFTVDMEKGNFIGRDALVRQKEEEVKSMLGFFTVDTGGNEDILPWGYENIYRNGELVGYVTSAAFGYTIGKPICTGYVSATGGRSVVTTGFLKEGHYEIDVSGEMCPAQISLKPLYDPKSLRVKM